MKLMLDTDICIYLIKEQPPSVLERFLSHPVGDIGISSKRGRSCEQVGSEVIVTMRQSP